MTCKHNHDAIELDRKRLSRYIGILAFNNRLVTKNTYEREMFDRASMKLGLDKALLQRMDNTSDTSGAADFFSKSKSQAASSLSKQEIEELLKKGAYGAFMDDESSKKFCEEDIDQILERRTMVIRHDSSSGEKGSVFAKASFQTDRSHNVDVNDPDFWDKVAKQAELEVIDEQQIEDQLILDMPRNRKQRQSYHGAQPESDEESGSQAKSSGRRPNDLKPWTITERTKLERCIMTHGYGNWKKYKEAIPRRSILHLRSVTRWLLTFAITKSIGLYDSDSAKDVIKNLSMYPLPVGPEETEEPGFFPLELDSVEPQIIEMVEADMPYPGCDDYEHYECISFFKEAPPDYLDHVIKKAKNMLIRVGLVIFIFLHIIDVQYSSSL